MLKGLETQNWTRALEISRAWEIDGRQIETNNAEPEPITVAIATDEFVAEARSRELNERTIYKYKFLFKQLCAFSDAEGVCYLKQLDVRLLRKFRATWKDRNLAALKKLERLRAFYRFAISNKWVENNMAKELKNPIVEDRQTLPYSHDEMFRILTAAETRIAECQAAGRDNARRFSCFVTAVFGSVTRYDATRHGSRTADSAYTRRKPGRMFISRYPSSFLTPWMPVQR